LGNSAIMVKFAYMYVTSHGVLQLVVAEGNMAILHSSNLTGLDGQFWELRRAPLKRQVISVPLVIKFDIL
jgi:hypothetical protein